MKSYFPFNKLTKTVIDDTASTISSASTLSNSTNFTPNRQARVKTLIQTLATKPETFKTIFDLAQTATKKSVGVSGYMADSAKMASQASKAASQLTGSLSSISRLFMRFGTEGMLPGLLRNGILTELATLTPEQSGEIFMQVFAHPFVQQQLEVAGLGSIKQALIGNANLTMELIRSISPDQLGRLSDNLANLIEIQTQKAKNNTEITATQALLDNPKSLTSMRGSRQTFVNQKTIENKQLEEAEVELIPIVRNSILQIISTQEVQPALHGLVNGILPTISAVADTHQNSPQIKEKIILKPEARISTLIDMSTPIINAALTHAEDFQNIASGYDAYIESGNPTHLIQTSSELLQRENVLSAIPSIADINLMNDQFLLTDIRELLPKAITELKKERVLAQVKQELHALLPKIFSLPHIQQGLEITPEQMQALPHAIEYAMDIAQNSLDQDLQPIANAIFEYQTAEDSDKPTKLVELAQAGIELIQNPQMLAIIAAKEKLTPIAEQFLPPELAKTAIDIGCDNKDYFLNIANTALAQPEMPKMIEAYQKYAAAKIEDKSEKLISLASNAAALANNPQMIEAILEPQSIDNIITEIAKQPLLKDMLKEDLSKLKQATMNIAPILFKAAETSEAAKLLQQIPNHEGSKIDLFKKIFKTYSEDSQAIDSVKTALLESHTKIAASIDLSLSSIKKDKESLKAITGEKDAFKASLAIRLLKPLGIDGKFIVSMLKKINTPKGLEALQKCMETPNVFNTLNLLSTTGTTTKVIGHIISSATKHLLGINSLQTNLIKEKASWVERSRAASNPQLTLASTR